MKHEVSYTFTDDYKTVCRVLNRLNDVGYGYEYKELQMADGTVHQFCVCCDRRLELPDMDAALKWICSDIHRLEEAYENGIVCKEAAEAAEAADAEKSIVRVARFI